MRIWYLSPVLGPRVSSFPVISLQHQAYLKSSNTHCMIRVVSITRFQVNLMSCHEVSFRIFKSYWSSPSTLWFLQRSHLYPTLNSSWRYQSSCNGINHTQVSEYETRTALFQNQTMWHLLLGMASCLSVIVSLTFGEEWEWVANTGIFLTFTW